MTREVKIGSAVAGSFLSLVGIVVGTKMYNGDVPKTIEGVVASADLKKDDAKIPDTPPGTLPATFLSETPLPPTNFPAPPPGGSLQLPGLPAPPADPKGFSLPPLPDPTKSFVDAGNNAAKQLQDTIAEQKKFAIGAVDKTKNDLNASVNTLVNDNARRIDDIAKQNTNDLINKSNTLLNSGNAKLEDLTNQGKSAINSLTIPKEPAFPTPPGNASLPTPPGVSLPAFPSGPSPVNVAENTIVGGAKPPTTPNPTPPPSPTLPSPTLPGLPEPPTPFGAPPSPGGTTTGLPPIGSPPAAPIVGDPTPKSGSLPPIGSPSAGFPTPPAPPVSSPGSPPAGNPFPTPPIESPATPIVGAPPIPTPAPPVSVRTDPTPTPFGAPPTPPAPFGSNPTPPPPPFGGNSTPVPPVGQPGFVPTPTPPISAPATPLQPNVKTDTPERYTCQGLDTFANLSARKYGNENFARALEEYNRDMPGAADNLRASPARLYPGTVVWLPSQNYLMDRYARFVNSGVAGGASLPPAPPPGQPAIGTRPLGSDVGISPPTPISSVPNAPRPPVNDVGITTYRVPAGGQYFSQIAERQLGSPLRWIDIYRLNLNFPPEQPIREGTEIRIPMK